MTYVEIYALRSDKTELLMARVATLSRATDYMREARERGFWGDLSTMNVVCRTSDVNDPEYGWNLSRNCWLVVPPKSSPSADFLQLKATFGLDSLSVQDAIPRFGWHGDGLTYVAHRDIGLGRELVIYQTDDPDEFPVVRMEVYSDEEVELPDFNGPGRPALTNMIGLGCPTVDAI